MNPMVSRPEPAGHHGKEQAYLGTTPPQAMPSTSASAHQPVSQAVAAKHNPTHIRYKFKFRWQTKEQLDISSPSRKDGLDAKKEDRWRRQYTMLIHDLGQKLNVPMWCIAAAVMLCHRFYAAKSMLKNDRFVIALACLFLASKVEENPKHIRKVVEEGERYLTQRKLTPQQLARNLDDKVLMEERKEEILMAERAILYTLGFQLNVSHPYKYLLEKLNEMKLLNVSNDSPYRRLTQDTWNLINDSLRTLVCMQYRPEHVAYTCLYLAAHINMVDLPLPGSPPPSFWVYFNIGQAELRGIAKQIFDMYEAAKAPELAELNNGLAPRIHDGQLKVEGGRMSLVLDSDAAPSSSTNPDSAWTPTPAGGTTPPVPGSTAHAAGGTGGTVWPRQGPGSEAGAGYGGPGGRGEDGASIKRGLEGGAAPWPSKSPRQV